MSSADLRSEGGPYESLAPHFLPAAAVVVAAANVQPGEHVVDLGCGTVSLLTGRRRVRVTGVDAATRLLDAAFYVAFADRLQITFGQGTATRLPIADAAADVVVSVFGALGRDSIGVANELDRVTAPSGRVLLSVLLPGSPFDELTAVSIDAHSPVTEGAQLPLFPWHSIATVADLLAPYDFAVTGREHELVFTAASPLDYWRNQHLIHPAAASLAFELRERGHLDEVEAGVLTVLDRVNEDPAAFQFTARYVVVEARRVRRPGRSRIS